MGRRKQSPAEAPEYLPSTTRAVAWGALFFAFLAFLMSGTTLFLTYKDGRLVDNFNKLVETIEKSRGTAPKDAASADDTAARSKVRDQLDRYAQMVQEGNTQARYYLEGLRADLDRLQEYSSREASTWMREAARAVDSARDELQTNAPDAARRLREMAANLGEKVRGAAGKASDAARDQLSPAPTPPTPREATQP